MIRQDDFWEVLMDVKEKGSGPDGIKIWNKVFKKISDQERAVALTRDLMEMNLESMEQVDLMIERYLSEIAG